MNKTIETALKKFQFKKAVLLQETDKISKTFCKKHRIEVYINPNESPEEIFETFAIAKLGEENPLLSNDYFSDYSESLEEQEDFKMIIFPLRLIWAVKNAKKYAPKFYDNIIRIYKEAYNEYLHLPDNVPAKVKNKASFLILPLTIILNDAKYPVSLEKNILFKDVKWLKYYEALKDFSNKNPDPSVFCEIPKVLQRNYKVWIDEEKGARLFSINKIHE